MAYDKVSLVPMGVLNHTSPTLLILKTLKPLGGGAGLKSWHKFEDAHCREKDKHPFRPRRPLVTSQSPQALLRWHFCSSRLTSLILL